jgi:hypothetical protein
LVLAAYLVQPVVALEQETLGAQVAIPLSAGQLFRSTRPTAAVLVLVVQRWLRQAVVALVLTARVVMAAVALPGQQEIVGALLGP